MIILVFNIGIGFPSQSGKRWKINLRSMARIKYYLPGICQYENIVDNMGINTDTIAPGIKKTP